LSVVEFAEVVLEVTGGVTGSVVEFAFGSVISGKEVLVYMTLKNSKTLVVFVVAD